MTVPATAAVDPRHDPVLLAEVIAGLAPAADEIHVDGTFGAGGYSKAIVSSGARVFAFDRDPDAIREGTDLADACGGRLTLVPERFSRMREALAEHGVDAVDGVTLDIGVSSMQLDRPERGFSFQSDGPLDMRMEQAGMSAAEFLNTADEGEIERVLRDYGDEPRARRVARAIVEARPLTTTAELAALCKRVLGQKPGDRKDPATRTFQAVRIHLNRELDELRDGLVAAERVLKPGGRLAVVSFHSAEDRIVKNFLRERSGATPAGSRHRPAAVAAAEPSFDAVAKPIRAGEAELARNPRSRSATLRVARRTSASSWRMHEKGQPQ